MSQIKLKADSGGGSVSLKAPATTTGNAALEITVPDVATGSSVVTADSSGDVAVTGKVAATGALTASNFSSRNIVINGAMNIAQRGTSAAATGFKTVDRWKFNGDWPGSAITQAQSDVAAGTTPYEKGFRKAWKVTNVSQSSAGASNFMHIDTKLEAQDIANSGWNYTSASSKITLSFWVKSSVAQTFYGYLYTSDGTEQQYPFSFALSADTWTKVTKTIPGHANLTFDHNANEGLRITIAQFYGTTYTDSGVTLDAWGAYSGTANLPDNTSTWFTTNAATFELTGVQLEVGDVATEFEHRSYGDELRKCQRYFYRHCSADYDPIGQGMTYYSGQAICTCSFPTTMRTKPSMTSYVGSSGGYNYRVVIHDASVYHHTIGMEATMSSTSIGTITCSASGQDHEANGVILLAHAGSPTNVAFDAEL